MDIERLRASLNKIGSLVYRATQEELEFKEEHELRDAMDDIKNTWPDEDCFKLKANLMCEWLLSSGILTEPPIKLSGAQAILEECQILERYLDNNTDTRSARPGGAGEFAS